MNKEDIWLQIPDTDIYITEETRKSFISRLDGAERIKIKPNNINYSTYEFYCSDHWFWAQPASKAMKDFFGISNLCFNKNGWI